MLRDPQGQPVVFKDPGTGQVYVGYDPTVKDANGNRVGDPTGRTHAVLFFDYDDDGDPDLWVANDGDRLQVFRNDSSEGDIRFTPVSQEMKIDTVGNWMGFAVGDYDGDADLDVFVTNQGYHLRLFPPQEEIGGDCRYTERFDIRRVESPDMSFPDARILPFSPHVEPGGRIREDEERLERPFHHFDILFFVALRVGGGREGCC